jgi:fibrillarin-like pre-rRNA processing protein
MGEQVEKMKKKVKKGVKQALAIWKIIITIILIALLIPLFLKNGWNSRFYFWIIAPSIILYIIIAYLQMKVLKGKMRKYVELTGTWLFGGILTLSATFIVMMLGYTHLGPCTPYRSSNHLCTLSPTTRLVEVALPMRLLVKPGKVKRLLTENLTPGKSFFDEELRKEKGKEYRTLDPRRSKLGAAIAKGLQQHGITEGKKMLYLGASHGYTPSFVSDMLGPSGWMICLDFAPRVVRDLVFVCEARENMAPLLGDAKHPETYAEQVPQELDLIFQDIAQRDQVDIFMKNCKQFLKKGGYGLLAVKARSIDVTKRPFEIFKRIKKEFESSNEYVIVDYRELDPFEKDHAFFVVKRR